MILGLGGQRDGPVPRESLELLTARADGMVVAELTEREE